MIISNFGNCSVTGGTFSNNRHNGTGLGAAVYNTSIAMCYISGGTFDSSNVAKSNNAGIFHSSRDYNASGEMHLSGDPAINCPLFLDAGTANKFICLDDALIGNVTLKPANYTEDYVLVKAAQGYTLTNDDYLNIKLLQPTNGTWYTKLSTDGQSIVATEAVGDRLDKVYLAPVSGVDTNNGATAETAIKTFDKAKQLLANGGTIILVPPVTISSHSNYVVIRVHNGTGAALATTQSGDDLTFKTDKFSTYAIAYTKAGGTTPPTPPSGSGSGGGKPPSAVTSSDKPNTPTTAETEIKAEVDKNGNAAVTLPVGTMEAAV